MVLGLGLGLGMSTFFFSGLALGSSTTPVCRDLDLLFSLWRRRPRDREREPDLGGLPVLEDLEDLEDMDFDFFGLEEVAIALDDELWCPC